MCSHFLSLGTALFKLASTVVARLLDFMVTRSLTVKNKNKHMAVLPLAGTSCTLCDNFLRASGFCSLVTLIHSMDWGVIMSSCYMLHLLHLPDLLDEDINCWCHHGMYHQELVVLTILILRKSHPSYLSDFG